MSCQMGPVGGQIASIGGALRQLKASGLSSGKVLEKRRRQSQGQKRIG